MLASPHFVFRFERVPPNVAPGTDYHISDVELASRLSFFLWGTHSRSRSCSTAPRAEALRSSDA